MRGERGGDWVLLFLREGVPETRRIRVGRGRAAAALLVAVSVPLLLGVALGRTWERGRVQERMEALQGQLDELAADRTRVAELGGKLQAIEASYLRIREAMAGEGASPEGAVNLPLPAAGEGLPPGADSTSGGPEWVWPLAEQGFVTRSYGFGEGPSGAGHPGVDIAVPQGSYVRSAMAGVVIEAGEDPVYGRYVRIAHGDGLSSLYAHNAWVFAGVGDTVEGREVIALSGNTGQSTAPHLHFEVTRNGETVDPLEYVPVGR